VSNPSMMHSIALDPRQTMQLIETRQLTYGRYRAERGTLEFYASLEKGVGGCKLNVTDMQSSPDRAVCVAGSNWHSTTAVRT
jgi:hypothetical protein